MSTIIHRDYSNILPTEFTGLSSFDDWISKIPTTEFTSGHAGLYEDGRIEWLVRQCGDLSDLDLLELGPFEAGHTYMLHRHNPRSIDAIEANKAFYLKCLCVKEAFNLHRAHFFLGSFIDWLRAPGKRYDLIVASGVLYHMTDPIELLDLLSSRASRVFLWTHYAPSEMYPDGHPLRSAYIGTETVTYRDAPVTLHRRSYLEAAANPTFCGGVRDDHAWLERDGILTILRKNGFNHLATEDQPGHPNGPCFSVYAQKDGA